MKTLLIGFFLFSLSTFVNAKTSWKESAIKSLPNAIMYDIANEDTSVYLVDREKLRTKNLGLKGGSSQFSFLTNGFSLTRLPDAHNIGVWELDWIPSFSIAFHNLTYESSTAFLDQTDFQLFRTSLGFGPELSYQTSLGRFAGNVTPGIAYSWISYSSPVSGGSVGRSN